MTKLMGQFDLPPRRSEKPKFCKNCHRPVTVTVGDCGYCKRCIVLAKDLNQGGN